MGPKEQQVVYDGDQGIRIDEVSSEDRDLSSLSDQMIAQLSQVALEVESMYEGLPQDIEWAFCDGVPALTAVSTNNKLAGAAH